MRSNILLISSSITTFFLFTGCATIIGGGQNQNIDIKSSKPQKVDVYRAGGLLHTDIQVPNTINVERSSKDILIKSKDGKCKEKYIAHETNPWVFGNIIMGIFGLSSTTTDASNGSMWKYDEDVTLDCE